MGKLCNTEQAVPSVGARLPVAHSQLLFFFLGGTNGVGAASVGSQCVSAGNLLCTLCSFVHEIFTPASLQLD